jgi:hypothetical protein
MRSNALLIVALVVIAAGGARYLPSVVTAPASQAPPSSAAQSNNSPPLTPATPRNGSDPDALTLLADYLDVDISSATEPLTMLKDRAGDKVDVEFLTVTVPDAVDSYVKWEFDNLMQAVQFAAGRLGLVLDRFYLPDWDPTADLETGRTLGRLHEQYPAVILFRRDSRVSGTGGKSHLLVTFLVAETPTSGVHKVALLRSLRLAHAWNPSAPLKLVAPVYSGSRESIRRVFADLRDEFKARNEDEPRFQLVSGGATGPDNKEFFETLPGVTFTATVHPDDQLEQGLKEFVARQIPRLSGANRIALFRESNTGWGVGGSNEVKFQWNANVQLLDIPFPLHISRLPSSADQRRGSGAMVQPFLPLPLTGARGATDQLPVTAPETTLPSMEIVMAQLLNTIRRERVSAAGLLATDARDRLFLAQQLSTKAPDLTLFTLETDLLYAHPTYGSDLRGMLTISTYPLFSGTQLWADPRGKNVSRLQFRSTSAQGIYNAVLMQLDSKGGLANHLLDYRDPFNPTAAAHPPVWISVVGRSGVWPLAFLEVADHNGYLATADSQRSGDDRQTIQLVRPTVPFAVATVTALVWMCCRLPF